ncbi:MAG TPA: hypothetical protein VJA18_02985 [Candidatus Nanoarchaeia archaeon]|nr:hypothetical protein [Candidatus Nanoarchaeia archaeon]
MNWTKLLYMLMIVLLYVPMVFLGANVFFPEYTGTNSYYHGPYTDCYGKHPYPADPDKLTTPERAVIDENQRKCNEEFQKAQEEFEQGKLSYEGRKYVFISLFNLGILLLALFLPKLQDSVTMGLFMGSIAATFGGTVRYFDTKSKIGFAILVVTFCAVLYFINRKKENFLDWGKGKK